MPTIVIDAGHGGHHAAGQSSPSGVRGPAGTQEKDVTLALAQRVAAHLGPGAVLTRSGDQSMTLAERSDIARRYGAGVFVSLHANGGARGRRGAETYIHTRADQPSRALARALRRELAAFGGSGADSADMAVLSPERLAPDTAACLLEVDYLSDPQGERRLRDPRSLDDLSRAIAAGIQRYAYGRRGPLATAQGPNELLARIDELVNDSDLVTYPWIGRGVAPIGYLRGMAKSYARVYCKYMVGPDEPEAWRDRFTVEMAKGVAPGANIFTDVLARHRNTFLNNFGVDLSLESFEVLRALFTVLFGLGMLESSGKHCVGWDRDKENGWGNPALAVVATETNAEAGLFQVSYDIGIGVNGSSFKDLYDRYRQRPDSGFLATFSEGVACNAFEGADFVGPGGPALEFQRFSKSCPAFTVELAALALRSRANHFGPINNNAVEIRHEAWTLLHGIELAIDELGGCVAVV
jgi:hypothetical protein